MVIETKGGRTATKVKTIVTSNPVKQTAREIDNGGTRRSNRTKQPTNKKIESMPSPSKPTTNGTPRSKSHATTLSNLYGELSLKKTSNFSPDVVSDLEEILGSPIKTTRSEQVSRTQSISEHVNAKNIDIKPQINDETKPATRSSKRLSNRVQPTVESMIDLKPVRTNNRGKKSSTAAVAYNAGHISEDSQDDNAYENLQNNTDENIVLNIKQEKEVSYTMTDESNNLLVCEMCSAVFTDRETLLAHVRVHI